MFSVSEIVNMKNGCENIFIAKRKCIFGEILDCWGFLFKEVNVCNLLDMLKFQLNQISAFIHRLKTVVC